MPISSINVSLTIFLVQLFITMSRVHTASDVILAIYSRCRKLLKRILYLYYLLFIYIPGHERFVHVHVTKQRQRNDHILLIQPILLMRNFPIPEIKPAFQLFVRRGVIAVNCSNTRWHRVIRSHEGATQHLLPSRTNEPRAPQALEH